MHTIVSKTTLAPQVYRIEVRAHAIARKAQAGQFIMLRVHKQGERIPLTIAGWDAEAGTITLIFQTLGTTTTALAALEPGETILDLAGPLGHPTEIIQYGTVVAVAGGVGAAEILPVAQALKGAGNRVIAIVGARTKDLVILESEIAAAAGQLLIATDDGTAGRKGLVTDVLGELIAGENINLVYAIGPVPMMRAVAELTRRHGIRTVVSLNPIMVDGTGMCGACRVSVGSETKFACVDGPEFDAHAVKWDELAARLKLFRDQERISFQTPRHDHGNCQCRKK